MKKKILKNVIAIAFIGILFTSCLGDGNTKLSREKDFVYIDVNEENGRKYGRTLETVFFYSPEIDEKLQQGDCVLMNYRINSDNMTSDNLFNAENVTFESEDIFRFENGKQIRASYRANGDTTLVETDEIFIDNSMNLMNYYYATTPYFADKWLFTFYYYQLEDERTEPELQVWYNSNLQGENLPSNERIIDFKLVKTQPGTGTKRTVKRIQRVVDFSVLRQYFNQYIGEDRVMYLRFRYRRYNDSNYDKFKMNTNTKSSNVSLVYPKTSE